VDEPLRQSFRRVERGDLRPERVERGTLGIGNDGRRFGEHPARGRDLRRRRPVGEVMPGTARTRDRPIGNANPVSVCCRRGVQRVQVAEQRAEVAEAARRADRVPPLMPGTGSAHSATSTERPSRTETGPSAAHRSAGNSCADRYCRIAASLATASADLRAGNQRAAQSGPSARPARHTPRSSSVISCRISLVG